MIAIIKNNDILNDIVNVFLDVFMIFLTIFCLLILFDKRKQWRTWLKSQFFLPAIHLMWKEMVWICMTFQSLHGCWLFSHTCEGKGSEFDFSVTAWVLIFQSIFHQVYHCFSHFSSSSHVFSAAIYCSNLFQFQFAPINLPCMSAIEQEFQIT